VSSAYDYHLQSIHLEAMNAMRSEACDAACSAAQHRTDLALQVRAVGVGGALMLVTNLLLVGWAVALRGGRMVLGSRREVTSVQNSRAHDLRLLLAAGLVGSAVVHAAVIPEHLEEWPAAGSFFVVLGIAELALGLVVLVRLDRLVLSAAVAVSVVPLGLWLVSRTVGLPLGPETWTPEAVGVADVGCGLLELVTLAAAVALWLRPSRLARTPGLSAHARVIAVLSLVAITTIGLGATEISWLHAFGVAGEPMSHAE
jgi:hypothetical protein